MEKIRYTQRICTDQNKLEEFLLKTRTGVIAIWGEDYPYPVPVNYVWYKGAIYFHGMGTGRKNELLQKNPKVSFLVYEEYGTVKAPVPCNADTSYLSVMIFGHAGRVEDFQECAEVLNKIVEKYMPGFYKNGISPTYVEKYRSSHDNRRTAVFKIVPVDMTAKENVAASDEIYGN